MPDLTKIIYTVASGLLVFFGHQVWSTANEAQQQATINKTEIRTMSESVTRIENKLDRLLERR
jgi:hypothetical protein